MFSGKEITLFALSTLIALIVLNYMSATPNPVCLIELTGHSAVLRGNNCESLTSGVIEALSAHLHGLRN
ncbi:triple gene block protein 3 [Papaya mosaic virus]|uniref:Movement protein TGBp3 n=2 Tax=Papaya mosaic potexvirus TaxID=12181 RepID=TGB3_PMV|nr:triple gene block protein 3 [Papaya mosaic virus]P20954.1 RecName: Full=Movement protein TGBp3; AltName: Full=7 kDa protein; AltName: Full=Triple gene block 3 protein; Short=TGBp3 [Papaya mosaic virus]AFV46464.1 triple gene block protein 3 [Papaya mosaic virus]BAA03053.1 unnamed protein product [Papaya mosaic virus]